jgi:hypothetical protein
MIGAAGGPCEAVGGFDGENRFRIRGTHAAIEAGGAEAGWMYHHSGITQQ